MGGRKNVPEEPEDSAAAEVVVAIEKLVDSMLEDEVTRVEEIVDMLLGETREGDAEVVDSDVETLLGFERSVGIPVDSTDELVGAVLDVNDSVSVLLSDATDLMILESSLGSGTFPLMVHPPEAPGQAGGLNVGL